MKSSENTLGRKQPGALRRVIGVVAGAAVIGTGAWSGHQLLETHNAHVDQQEKAAAVRMVDQKANQLAVATAASLAKSREGKPLVIAGVTGNNISFLTAVDRDKSEGIWSFDYDPTTGKGEFSGSVTTDSSGDKIDRHYVVDFKNSKPNQPSSDKFDAAQIPILVESSQITTLEVGGYVDSADRDGSGSNFWRASVGKDGVKFTSNDGGLGAVYDSNPGDTNYSGVMDTTSHFVDFYGRQINDEFFR